MRSEWELLLRGMLINIDALPMVEAAVLEVLQAEDRHGLMHVRWRLRVRGAKPVPKLVDMGLPGRPLQVVLDGLQRSPLADRVRMRIAKVHADSPMVRT